MSARRTQRVHFISGASGAGTSTRAFAIRRDWESEPDARPVAVIATDVVRAQLRTVLAADTHPDLWGESFNLPASPGDHLRDGVSVEAFLRQCGPILRAVEAAVAYALTEGWDIVVEGVHLVPGLFEAPHAADVETTFELLFVEDEATHRAQLEARDVASQGRRSAAHYITNLTRIRVIQDELRERYDLLGRTAGTSR
jgi:2-phosphoglycerate kinase